MPKQLLAELAMLARLTRDLPTFLRNPITAEQAWRIVKQRLDTRPDHFLYVTERHIYRHPRSPYLKLLHGVGCELGDLRNLVASEGVDAALRRLAAQGVYVSLEEFKGQSDIIRGSQRFAPTQEDFDNPRLQPHFEQLTGGSRGQRKSVKTALYHAAEQAPNHKLAFDAHGLGQADQALWGTAPLLSLFTYAKAGRPVIAWFHPLKPLPWKAQAIAAYLRLVGQLVGCPFPRPVWRDLENPGQLARCLSHQAEEGRLICVRAYASSAVRAAIAAQQEGYSLDGVTFVTIGEPFTEAKQRALESVGARALVQYGSTEATTFAYQCAQPRSSDDLHFFADNYALIQRARPEGDGRFSVNAFLVSTLLYSAPKIMLNVETGDHGTLERRDCGCALGAIGFNEHLSDIRSHEKLTGEGMTFVKTQLMRVLEEVLPRCFGGSSADYQVLEEEDSRGVLRLSLLVNPTVGSVDEAQLKRTFLQELGRDSERDQYMSTVWERAGTVQVRRQAPIATSAGKVLPFHLVRPEAQAS